MTIIKNVLTYMKYELNEIKSLIIYEYYDDIE